MFETEKEMSKMFENYLKLTFGNTYFKEYQGLFGIPDFVFYAKYEKKIAIISFELKLKNWKRAAQQAFRYKSFSNIAYVVLSAQNSDIALSNIDLFKKYNIGLAKFDNEHNFEILYKPKKGNPYSESLNCKVVNSISSVKKKSKNLEKLIS